MIAEQILIDALVKQKEDRVPEWVRRADWSSHDTLLAFWSAYPPELRDDFLKARAESSAANFRAQIIKCRAEQSAIVQARRTLIRVHVKIVAEMTVTPLYRFHRKKLRKELCEELAALRAKMRVSRDEVRRCVRYLRAVQPKKVNQINLLGEMIGAMTGKRVNIIVQKPQTYQVLSLWQPWASMVAWGLKEYETRSWSTSHRGLMLIHAAKRWTEEEKRYCRAHPFSTAIRNRLGGSISDFPFGKIIAVAELVAIYPTATLKGLSHDERAVGNFAPGRFAWRLTNVRELKTPLAVKGGQGLFKWTGVIDV